MVRPKHPLGPYPDKLTERLDHWAVHAPDRIFLAERRSQWRMAHRDLCANACSARNVAQALLERPLSDERPIAILSGNDLEHAALGLGAMYAGIPFAPISPAYSLVSSDFGKLRLIFDILTPGLVFVSAGAPFRKAIEAVMPRDAELVISGDPGRLRATPFSMLETGAATACRGSSARRRRPRYHREVSLHVGIDGHAQRRHQYPAHAMQQSGNRAHHAAVRGG